MVRYDSVEDWQRVKDSIKEGINVALEKGSPHEETLKIMEEILESVKVSTSIYDVIDDEV